MEERTESYNSHSVLREFSRTLDLRCNVPSQCLVVMKQRRRASRWFEMEFFFWKKNIIGVHTFILGMYFQMPEQIIVFCVMAPTGYEQNMLSCKEINAGQILQIGSFTSAMLRPANLIEISVISAYLSERDEKSFKVAKSSLHFDPRSPQRWHC